MNVYLRDPALAPVEPVSSLDDPRLADYRNVRDGELMRQRGLFMAEGRLVVRTLLTDSRFRARSVLVTDAALEAASAWLPPSDGPPVYVAPQQLMNEVAGFDVHRGCLAAGERGPDLTVGEVLTDLAPRGAQPALVVVLEGLTNHDNVGGVFRAAAALGAGAVLLDPRCCDPLYRKAIRVSMGAALLIPFARAALPELLEALQSAGFATVALTPAPGARDIETLTGDADRPRRVALLLGAEGPGLSHAALEQAEHRVRIPMAPGVDSLNVATAAAIAMHRLGPLSR